MPRPDGGVSTSRSNEMSDDSRAVTNSNQQPTRQQSFYNFIIYQKVIVVYAVLRRIDGPPLRFLLRAVGELIRPQPQSLGNRNASRISVRGSLHLGRLGGPLGLFIHRSRPPDMHLSCFFTCRFLPDIRGMQHVKAEAHLHQSNRTCFIY